MDAVADLSGSAAMDSVLLSSSRLQRVHLVQLGLWMFLGTVTMLFAAFTSAYIVRRSSPDWLVTTLPVVLWRNTACLVASSLALEIGRFLGRRKQWGGARAAVGATVVLGVAFLVGQFEAWQDLAAAGVFLPTSPHSAFFFVLTGAHAAHLGAGLILLTVTLAYTGPGPGRLSVTPLAMMTLGATFWHFFGLLWLYLFFLLTVF